MRPPFYEVSPSVKSLAQEKKKQFSFIRSIDFSYECKPGSVLTIIFHCTNRGKVKNSVIISVLAKSGFVKIHQSFM